MAYLTVEQLKTMNVVDIIKNATAEQDIKVQAVLNYCSSLIDAYVGFSFVEEKDVTIYTDGDGHNKIALPKRIIKITSISTTDGYNYSVSDMRIVGERKKKVLNVKESFDDGCDNLVVVGDFGWETVPQDVIDCLVLLCNSNYNILNDEEVLDKLARPFQQEKIGDYSYTLDKKYNSVTGDNIDTTGNINVDQILDKYRDDFSIGVV